MPWKGTSCILCGDTQLPACFRIPPRNFYLDSSLLPAWKVNNQRGRYMKLSSNQSSSFYNNTPPFHMSFICSRQTASLTILVFFGVLFNYHKACYLYGAWQPIGQGPRIYPWWGVSSHADKHHMQTRSKSQRGNEVLTECVTSDEEEG